MSSRRLTMAKMDGQMTLEQGFADFIRSRNMLNVTKATLTYYQQYWRKFAPFAEEQGVKKVYQITDSNKLDI